MTIARRDFLRWGGACAAHLAWLPRSGAAAGLFAARAPERVVQVEPWGRLERLTDGVWALVSTPLDDGTTLCNGGIVAGTESVAVIEAFATARGARWMAERARALTGRWPDHVVVTHFHRDHSEGVAGYRREDASPTLHVTDETRAAVDAGAEAREMGPESPLRRSFALATKLSAQRPTPLDLGGRVLWVEPLKGHTASDVTLTLDDPAVVFCGDLVWNGMFPNYVDARPSALSASVKALLRPGRGTVYVPGHGALADDADLARYREVLDAVELAARDAHRAGRSAAEAAEGFRLPAELGEWMRFSPSYPERALAAWLRELDAG